MKILLYRWKVFNQDDVKSAIEYFGHEYMITQKQ